MSLFRWNSLVSLTQGSISMSTPALMTSRSTSSSSKLSAMAAMSSASETTTPPKPMSPRSMSVRMVLLMVAGRKIFSPVETEV